MMRSRVSVSLLLPFALATAADDSAPTMPEQLLRIEWHNSTNPLNYKRLNRVSLPRRYDSGKIIYGFSVTNLSCTLKNIRLGELASQSWWEAWQHSHGNPELLAVKDKVGRFPGELG